MKELIFANDPYQMNWLREDFSYGKTEGPEELSYSVENIREGDTVTTRITISNPGNKPFFTHNGSVSIAFPLTDKYESSRISLTRHCHTHIFCGGNISYICALRMGGEAPHLGMVLTKGSLAGYSVRRNLLNQSNDRGCFLLHPEAMELAPGESRTLEWKIFRHEGKADFFKKLKQYCPRFVEVTAERYVLFEGEKNVLRIRPAFAAGQVEVDGRPLPETDGEYRLEYTAREIGEKIFAIQVDGVRTWCRTYVQEDIRTLAGKRCAFLAQHQQYRGPVASLRDAYLAYDNEEERCVYRPENDFNGGRERIGMGVLMARYLAGQKESRDPRLLDSLERYRAYVLRELVDGETGKVCNDIGKDGSYKRLYNVPWAAVFFTELYLLRKEKEDLLIAYRIEKQFYAEGGRDFYPINLPILLLDGALSEAKLEPQRQELMTLSIQHAERILERDINYPSSEVNYEQSIVAPGAEILLSAYALTKDEKYLRGAERQMAVLDLFNGMQPDYRLYEAAIRHWDGYWFGKKRYFGDTFPHYWSVLTGNVFELYGRLTGNPEYLNRAENSRRAILPTFFPDGRASCAYVFPYSVNGQRGEFYDPYANDQDWGLYFYFCK